MNAINSISQCLISSRNILLNGKCNDNISLCLKDVLGKLDLISVESTKEIISFCVMEVIEQIKNMNFVSAGRILNLIHNFPLDDVSEAAWDIDYFLSMELVTFLENFENIESSRKISLYIFGQLSSRYFVGV